MGRDGFVDDLYVVPEWRGRGIGSALLKQLTDACVELGVRALHLEVGRKKTDARALYRRFGFEEHDRLLMTRVVVGAGD
jgi:GNAT superfamily N-acetyltransferase